MLDELGNKLNNLDAKSLAKIMLTVSIVGILVVILLIFRVFKTADRQKKELEKKGKNQPNVSEQMNKVKKEIMNNESYKTVTNMFENK